VKRALLGLLLGALGTAPLAAQHVIVGPEVALADYREASAGLRYGGVGPGAAAELTFGRFAADVAFASIEMSPSKDSQATESFRATLIEGSVAVQALEYLSFEVGATKRSADSEFAAQSVGAVRVGARTRYVLGPGASVWLRGAYLAAAQFSGGGSAPVAMELGLGLDIRWSRHLRMAAQYAFQRLDRKTNPAGGPEVSVPIEQSLARLRLAVAF
jgi:hypothetical protein